MQDESREIPQEIRQLTEDEYNERCKLLDLIPDPSYQDTEISRAFRKVAFKYHPDKFRNKPENEKNEAEEKFKEINNASADLIAHIQVYGQNNFKGQDFKFQSNKPFSNSYKNKQKDADLNSLKKPQNLDEALKLIVELIPHISAIQRTLFVCLVNIIDEQFTAQSFKRFKPRIRDIKTSVKEAIDEKNKKATELLLAVIEKIVVYFDGLEDCYNAICPSTANSKDNDFYAKNFFKSSEADQRTFILALEFIKKILVGVRRKIIEIPCELQITEDVSRWDLLRYEGNSDPSTLKIYKMENSNQWMLSGLNDHGKPVTKEITDKEICDQLNKPIKHSEERPLLINLVAIIDRTIVFPQITHANEPLLITDGTKSQGQPVRSITNNPKSQSQASQLLPFLSGPKKEEKQEVDFADDLISTLLNTVKTKRESLESSNYWATIGGFQWNKFVNMEKNEDKIEGLKAIEQSLKTYESSMQYFSTDTALYLLGRISQIETKNPELTNGDTKTVLDEIKASLNPSSSIKSLTTIINI